MSRKTTENCPISEQTPPAQIDEDGWCDEHGWDCDDAERFHGWLSALHQSPKDLLGDPEDYTFLMHQPQQTPMSSQDCDDVESD